ncbi:MAG TPA: hypothetical protein VFG04_10310 [Planctomycetaceae bacterium]|nr:hypothetical protein [Planctomycetaceae bacterium]
MGWMQGSTTTSTTAAKDPANPLKGSDSSGSGSSTPAGDSSTGSASTGSSDKAASGGGFKAAAIDPALRKLMEDELQSEPADKRQQLMADWSKFDPAFIRELVENHKMARELAESHRAGKDSSGGWDGTGNGGGAVKTATHDQSPQTPVFDDPSAPIDSVLHPRSAAATPTTTATNSATATNTATGVRPTTAVASSAVSPWDDPPSTPSQSSRPPAAPLTSQAQPPGAPAVAATASASPARTATKSDIWDFGGTSPSPAPGNQRVVATPGTSGEKPDQPAATSATLSSTPPATASAPKADAFADLTPINTDPAPTPGRLQTTNTLAPRSATPGSAQPAVPNPFGEGPASQPGGAAPPNVVAGMPSGRGGPGSVVQTASAAVEGSGVGLASATTPSNPPNGFESEQPVKLSLPVDVPEGQVVAASDPGTNAPRAAQASATGRPTSDAPPSTTTPAPPASGLASLPSRLLGAINPLPGAGGSRNISLPANWHDELQKIVSVAASDAGQTSVGNSDPEKLAYIQKQVNLRMLYLLSGQPTRALEPIPGLEGADQEFWQQVFWGMSSYFDRSTIADPRDRATQTIAQLRVAVNKLQEKSKLELRNVSFCNKIENYGRYERFKRDEFTAGQPVLLYAEVENFKSEQVTEGYRAILKSTIEIFDTRGTLVQKMPFAANEDQCASPRRDYYNSYEFAIPREISLGPHTLKLTVEDQLSQKVASYTVNFTVK